MNPTAPSDASTSWTPSILRVAGLPAEAMERFRSSICDRIPRLSALDTDLAEARAEAVDLLHEAVPGAPKKFRRFLLRLKRDCFNGRPLDGYPHASAWNDLDPAIREAVRKGIRLERERDDWTQGILSAYREQRIDERRGLCELLANRDFHRGIALASSTLASRTDRLRRRSPADYGRKELKLEQSVLRFVSRAALKLSPFSTLTPVALALVQDGSRPDAPALQFAADRWRQCSLLRLKRYLFHQCAEVLFSRPEVRERLDLALNTSLERIGPDRFRFFRRGYRGPDPASGDTKLFQPSLVKARLDPDLVAHLGRVFSGRRLAYSHALEATETYLVTAGDPENAREQAAAKLQHLLAVGCLETVVPWRISDVHLEEEFLDLVRSLPDHRDLEAIGARTERLLELERGFSGAPDPAAVVDEIPALLRDIWRTVISFAGLSPDARFVQAEKGDLYEDVFLVPDNRERDALATVSRSMVERIAANVEPFLELGSFYSRRPDLLLTLTAFSQREWPEREEVGLLELFSATQTLWREYLRCEVAVRSGGDWKSTFNPLDLPRLEEIRTTREELWPQVESSLTTRGDGAWLSKEEIESFCAEIPEAYRLLVGGCLFVQPANRDGSLWVLNRVYEGTGRYGSRYTATMEPDLRRRYAQHFSQQSSFVIGDRPAQLLDLLCAQGDTLNVHAIQTPKVVELPGEVSGAPPDRLVTLDELRVRLPRSDGETPRLVDRSGQWLLPVHLGGTSLRFMPVLVKFLAMFGPGDLKPVIPMGNFRPDGDIAVRRRVTLDNVVLLRKRWRLELSAVLEELGEASDSSFFLALNRWRLERGIPDRVFVLEKRQSSLLDNLYKPQFIDFTSPSLVAVFRGLSRWTPCPIVLEEMLPLPEDFPTAADGKRWAVELQCDTLALGNRGLQASRQPRIQDRVPSSTTTVEEVQ